MNKYKALGIIEDFINSEYFPNELVNTLDYTTDEDQYEHVVMCYMNTNDEVFNELQNTSIPVDYVPTEDTVHGKFILAFKKYIQSSEYNDFDTSKFNVTTTSDNEIVLEIKDENIDFENNIKDDKKSDKKNEGNVEINTISSLQKPDESAFTNVIDNIGDCSLCGELQVPVDAHCCTKTISTEITDVTEMVTTLNDFKALLEKNKNK